MLHWEDENKANFFCLLNNAESCSVEDVEELLHNELSLPYYAEFLGCKREGTDMYAFFFLDTYVVADRVYESIRSQLLALALTKHQLPANADLVEVQ